MAKSAHFVNGGFDSVKIVRDTIASSSSVHCNVRLFVATGDRGLEWKRGDDKGEVDAVAGGSVIVGKNDDKDL